MKTLSLIIVFGLFFFPTGLTAVIASKDLIKIETGTPSSPIEEVFPVSLTRIPPSLSSDNPDTPLELVPQIKYNSSGTDEGNSADDEKWDTLTPHYQCNVDGSLSERHLNKTYQWNGSVPKHKSLSCCHQYKQFLFDAATLAELAAYNESDTENHF